MIKPTELQWVGFETAATWPEGSRILCGPKDDKNPSLPYWPAVEMHSYHRPDWCDMAGSTFSKYHAKLLYVLLALPPE